MINMEEFNKKLFYGDHLTDQELLEAKSIYQNLCESIKKVENKDYKLFLVDVTSKLNTIESYIRARKLE